LTQEPSGDDLRPITAPAVAARLNATARWRRNLLRTRRGWREWGNRGSRDLHRAAGHALSATLAWLVLSGCGSARRQDRRPHRGSSAPDRATRSTALGDRKGWRTEGPQQRPWQLVLVRKESEIGDCAGLRSRRGSGRQRIASWVDQSPAFVPCGARFGPPQRLLYPRADRAPSGGRGYQRATSRALAAGSPASIRGSRAVARE
jgi:hypothetical protein